MPAPAANRQTRRRERTRAQLVASARRLFAAQGVDATTIAQLAEGADVAVGSFYNHFETKEDLLEALVRETLAGEAQALKARQARVDDHAERVSVAHRHLVAAAAHDPEWGWLLVRLDQPMELAFGVLTEPATADLQAGIRAGRFTVADPAVALRASGGALMAVIHGLLAGELHGDVGAAHAEGVLRSLGVPPDEAAQIARRPLPDPA